MRLAKLPETKLAGAMHMPSGAQLLYFSPEAQLLFSQWYVADEKSVGNGLMDAARQSHFAKYRSLIPALALLFHLLDGHGDQVYDECHHRLIGFAKYLKKHANRFLFFRIWA